MRNIHSFIAVCGLILGTGCQMLVKDVESAMAGKYAQEKPQKGAVLYDTLVITPVSASAHQYLVEQRIVSKKNGSGVILGKSREKYAAFFNKDKNILEIPELMTYLSFDGNSLFAGSVQYKKL